MPHCTKDPQRDQNLDNDPNEGLTRVLLRPNGPGLSWLGGLLGLLKLLRSYKALLASTGSFRKDGSWRIWGPIAVPLASPSV